LLYCLFIHWAIFLLGCGFNLLELNQHILDAFELFFKILYLFAQLPLLRYYGFPFIWSMLQKGQAKQLYKQNNKKHNESWIISLPNFINGLINDGKQLIQTHILETSNEIREINFQQWSFNLSHLYCNYNRYVFINYQLESFIKSGLSFKREPQEINLENSL